MTFEADNLVCLSQGTRMYIYWNLQLSVVRQVILADSYDRTSDSISKNMTISKLKSSFVNGLYIIHPAQPSKPDLENIIGQQFLPNGIHLKDEIKRRAKDNNIDKDTEISKGVSKLRSTQADT